MNIASKLLKLKKQNQTIFSYGEILQLFADLDKKDVENSIFYAINKKYLKTVTKGIYAIVEEYSKQEFANKYRKPSYISLYTILQDEGVVFQPYSSIYIVSNRSETVEVDNQKYIYRQIKNDILLNPLGIRMDTTSKASVERAICDKLYLDGDEYFDNLRNVNWNFMKELNETVYKNLVIDNFIEKNKDESIRYK